MSCPYLKEVVMLFCRAYPVRKMVPLDRIASGEPCLGKDFDNCPLFRELMARMEAVDQPPCAAPRPVTERGKGKEVPQ